MTGLRILSIAPVRLPDAEIARRQQRFDALGGGGLTIELVNLEGAEAPLSLDSHDSVLASTGLVEAQAYAVEPDRYDLVMPDCVLDPGFVPGAKTPVPVIGLLNIVAGHLVAIGRRFSSVTRNDVIGTEFARRITDYGFIDHFDGVDVINGSIELISDDAEWMKRLGAVAHARSVDGPGIILNGCSAVEIANPVMSGIAVIDPTALAVQLIRIGHRERLPGAFQEPR
jgi:Asp/Glu/hydantoin racemase